MSKKVTDLNELDPPTISDLMHIVDVSDLTDSPQGSSKKMTMEILRNLMSGSAVVPVESSGDFPDPVGGVITLEAGKLYLLSQFISTGVNRIDYSLGGNIVGYHSAHSGLIYTGAGTYFTASAPNNLFLKDLSVIATGGGTFISLSGTGSEVISLNGTNVSGFASLGSIASVDVFALARTQVSGFTSGLTFSGSNNGNLFFDDMTYSPGAGALTIIDLASSIWEGFINNQVQYNIVSGQTAISGLVDNGNLTATGSASVTHCSFIGAGTRLNNITNKDTQWAFDGNTGNDGVEDTAYQGSLFMEENTTQTAVAILNDWYKIEGTTTSPPATNSQFSSPSSNELQVDVIDDRSYTIEAIFAVERGDGSGSPNAEFAIYVNGEKSVDCPSMHRVINDGSPGSVSLLCVAILSTNDTIEIYARNTTNTSNILVTDMQVVVH